MHYQKSEDAKTINQAVQILTQAWHITAQHMQVCRHLFLQNNLFLFLLFHNLCWYGIELDCTRIEEDAKAIYQVVQILAQHSIAQHSTAQHMQVCQLFVQNSLFLFLLFHNLCWYRIELKCTKSKEDGKVDAQNNRKCAGLCWWCCGGSKKYLLPTAFIVVEKFQLEKHRL